MAENEHGYSCKTFEGESFIHLDQDDEIDFSNSVFIGCSMPTSMSELDASNAYFERCDFRGAEGTMIIDGATFKDCDFTGSHIKGLSRQPGMAHVDIPLSELMGERTEFAVDSYLAEVELPQGADGKTVYDILERARLDHLAEQRDAEATSDVFDTLGLDRSVWEKDVMRSSIFNNGREEKLQKDFENLLGLNKDPEVTVTPVSDVKRFNGVEGDYRVPRDLPKPEDGPIFRPVSIPGPNDGPLRPNPMPRPKDGPIFEPLPKDDGGYVTFKPIDGDYDNDTNDGRDDKPRDDGPSL